MNCSRNDVVLLPIPFSDLTSSKVRPAIVIGRGSFPEDIFLVPVTSRLDQVDFALADWQACGLNVPSGIKAQIATVDSRLVRKTIGSLARADTENLSHHLRQWLDLP